MKRVIKYIYYIKTPYTEKEMEELDKYYNYRYELTQVKV